MVDEAGIKVQFRRKRVKTENDMEIDGSMTRLTMRMCCWGGWRGLWEYRDGRELIGEIGFCILCCISSPIGYIRDINPQSRANHLPPGSPRRRLRLLINRRPCSLPTLETYG